MPHKHPSEHRPHHLSYANHQHKKTEVTPSKFRGKVTWIGKKRFPSEDEVLKVLAKYGMRGFWKKKSPKIKSPKIGRNFKGWTEVATDKTPLQFIEDCRDRHKDKEIWIVGSGPSLDDFPDDFFDSEKKISIAVKYARVAFPNCTYYHDSYRSLITQVFIRNNRLNRLKKFIFQLSGNHQPNWPAGYNDKPIYQRVSKGSLTEGAIRCAVGNILKRGAVYGQHGTLIHYAIIAAIIFGAKQITLVGCEHRMVNEQKYAKKRGLSLFYWRRENDAELWRKAQKAPMVEEGTQRLVQAFKPYGIKIERYFYNRGYEKIV